ncbi:MAG: hypothetical protein V8R51_06425 [Clostridia bacterium]
MYEYNGTKAQKFKIEKAEKNESTQTIEDGIYNVVSKVNDNKVLQNRDKINLYQIMQKQNLT